MQTITQKRILFARIPSNLDMIHPSASIEAPYRLSSTQSPLQPESFAFRLHYMNLRSGYLFAAEHTSFPPFCFDFFHFVSSVIRMRLAKP
jgi:hypothetical protein